MNNSGENFNLTFEKEDTSKMSKKNDKDDQDDDNDTVESDDDDVFSDFSEIDAEPTLDLGDYEVGTDINSGT